MKTMLPEQLRDKQVVIKLKSYAANGLFTQKSNLLKIVFRFLVYQKIVKKG